VSVFRRFCRIDKVAMCRLWIDAASSSRIEKPLTMARISAVIAGKRRRCARSLVGTIEGRPDGVTLL
jgi:hypothetical protein